MDFQKIIFVSESVDEIRAQIDADFEDDDFSDDENERFVVNNSSSSSNSSNLSLSQSTSKTVESVAASSRSDAFSAVSSIHPQRTATATIKLAPSPKVTRKRSKSPPASKSTTASNVVRSELRILYYSIFYHHRLFACAKFQSLLSL